MKRIRLLIVASVGVFFLVACRDASLPTAVDPAVVNRAADVRTGWIFGPDGNPIELRYVIIDGLSILEGDINLGPAGTVAETREELLRGIQLAPGLRALVVIDGSDFRWPNGTVPYSIDPAFSGTEQQVILDAMAAIASKTAGTRFVPWTTEDSYVRFEPHETSCSSPVGRRGGRQTILLDREAYCSFNVGAVTHEILHSLGSWHEQSRCDRDSYVTIHYANIQQGMEHNFDMRCTGSSDILSYAETSLMHYSRFAFSWNGQPTISSTRGLDHLIGQHNGQMNQTDVSSINVVYQPYPVFVTSLSYPSGTPTLSWNASPTAIDYVVNHVIVYELYDWGAYESYDYSVTPVGTTTGLSMQDPQNPYTGCSSQTIYRDGYNVYEVYTAYYEVLARYPDAVFSRTNRLLAENMGCGW